MQLTITIPDNLFLVLRYDALQQSISATFSTGDPNQLTDQQKAAMQLVTNELPAYVAPYLYKEITPKTMTSIKNDVSQLLNKIHRETGIEIMLDDAGFIQDKYSYRYDPKYVF
jgi:hypothetical protein